MPQLQLVQLILNNYRNLLGTDLLPAAYSPAEAVHWLQYQAPFCVLAHDASADPCFIFANHAAQTCFEYTHAELIGMPSRLSAEAPNRAEREKLLATVNQQGYASGYRGLRIAKSGRRFWIENVTMWNLLDEAGITHGQAAIYREWRNAD